MKEKLCPETAVACRLFEVAGRPGETVGVFVGKPERLHEEEWACPYRITGAGRDICFQVHGIDSVQALQLVWKVIDGVIAGEGLELLLYGEPFKGFAAGL